MVMHDEVQRGYPWECRTFCTYPVLTNRHMTNKRRLHATRSHRGSTAAWRAMADDCGRYTGRSSKWLWTLSFARWREEKNFFSADKGKTKKAFFYFMSWKSRGAIHIFNRTFHCTCQICAQQFAPRFLFVHWETYKIKTKVHTPIISVYFLCLNIFHRPDFCHCCATQRKATRGAHWCAKKNGLGFDRRWKWRTSENMHLWKEFWDWILLLWKRFIQIYKDKK